MDWVPILIVGVQLLGFAFVVVALVYLTVRRIRKKKDETFENRDN